MRCALRAKIKSRQRCWRRRGGVLLLLVDIIIDDIFTALLIPDVCARRCPFLFSRSARASARADAPSSATARAAIIRQRQQKRARRAPRRERAILRDATSIGIFFFFAIMIIVITRYLPPSRRRRHASSARHCHDARACASTHARLSSLFCHYARRHYAMPRLAAPFCLSAAMLTLNAPRRALFDALTYYMMLLVLVIISAAARHTMPCERHAMPLFFAIMSHH